MIEVSFKPSQSDSEMANALLSSMVSSTNDILTSSANIVRQRIVNKIEDAIRGSGEIQSLINGKLKQEIGLVNGDAAVSQIVVAVQNSMRFEVTPLRVSGTRITGGGYEIQILREDFREVLNTDSASYITENNAIIPWLEWLLFAGTASVIIGYKILYDPQKSEFSRTSGPIMVPSNGSWGVPAEFSGTGNNNILTRALSNISSEIDEIINSELTNG